MGKIKLYVTVNGVNSNKISRIIPWFYGERK